MEQKEISAGVSTRVQLTYVPFAILDFGASEVHLLVFFC